jgi:hypothetical protein
MPELVRVSNVEHLDALMTYINELFGKGKYAEIIQAIGMYSLLIDSEHTLGDQDRLYRLVLNLIKKKQAHDMPHTFAKWIASFPQLLAGMVSKGDFVTDEAARSELASHHAAYGPFASLDAFYFWALDDRRLPLDQIVRYIEGTTKIFRS